MSDLEARRIALRAQGFASPGSPQEVSATVIRRAIGRLGLLQIDSVNVLVRAHYMPLFSRLGPYDRGLLDAMARASSKAFFEYWGHEASLLPIELQPLVRWRMARAQRGEGIWRQLQPFAWQRRSEADALLARIAQEGALAASDVAGSKAAKGLWVWSSDSRSFVGAKLAFRRYGRPVMREGRSADRPADRAILKGRHDAG